MGQIQFRQIEMNIKGRNPNLKTCNILENLMNYNNICNKIQTENLKIKTFHNF